MNDLVEIIHSLRVQLDTSKFTALEKAFQVNGLTIVQFDNFEAILGKVGIFLKRQELTRLYRHFDPDHTESMKSADFLKALKGEMSERVEGMVKGVWDVVLGGAAACPVDQLFSAYDPTGHPDVSTGAKTPQQIEMDLKKAVMFSGIIGDTMTWEQFHDLMGAISAASPYDENNFIACLEGTFKISEGSGAPGQAVPIGFLEQVQSVLWEKVRQRTKASSQESETLRLALAKLDLESTGSLGYDTFCFGLEQFGVILEKHISRALFDNYAQHDYVNIAEFSTSVCEVATA